MTNVESVNAARALATEVGRPVVVAEAAKELLRRPDRALAA
jgi:hypothetical protein